MNRLAFPYRWSTRAILMDKTDATRLLTKIRRQWFAKRKSVAAILKEVMTNEASVLVDTDAANKAADADLAPSARDRFIAKAKEDLPSLLDGPLAFDNAISPKAVKIKGIESKVAGQADILVVPDLEAGNMLAKQLEYFGAADSAGIVVCTRVPIALTSRSDATDTRLASMLLVQLVAHHYRQNPP